MDDLELVRLTNMLRDRVDFFLSQGIVGHQIEYELRMEVEAAIQTVLDECHKLIGIEQPKVKIGQSTLSRQETIDLLTTGIPHNGCLSTSKILTGLEMQLSKVLPENTLIMNDGMVSLSITESGAEIVYVTVDANKINIFHGANVSPTSIESIHHVMTIFPVIYDFTQQMNSVKDAKSGGSDNNTTKTKKKTPDFEWI
tara:strand:+ start:283 stop:876 length:594 start_codon:yes stop_codon:yes gene_type:complete